MILGIYCPNNAAERRAKSYAIGRKEFHEPAGIEQLLPWSDFI